MQNSNCMVTHSQVPSFMNLAQEKFAFLVQQTSFASEFERLQNVMQDLKKENYNLKVQLK